jgi:hypothetical protein
MIFLLLILSLNAISAEWWKDSRVELPDSYIYTGYSEGDAPADELKERAFAQISTLIVREHMGFRLDADESVIESLDQAQYQSVTRIRSVPIILKGLTLIDQREEKAGKGKRVYIRVKISKKELQDITRHAYDDRIDNVYGEVNIKNSSIIIKTSPAGAFLELTHLQSRFQVYGNGNAKFNLPEGQYELIARHPGYEKIQKNVLVKGELTIETLQFKPLRGSLMIETAPSSAKIEPLHPVKGSNPYELIPQKTYKFRVSHPDYFSQEFDVSVPDERRMSYSVNLVPRPSQVRFYVEPEHAKFYFGDIEKNHKDVLNLNQGEYSVRIEAKGYETYNSILVVAPNKIYPTHHVKLDLEPEFNWRFEYLPIEKRQSRAQLSLIPGNLYREWDYFAFGGGISLDTDRSIDNGQEVIVSVSDIHFGARLLLPRFWNFRTYGLATIGSYVIESENYSEYSKSGFRYQYSYVSTGFGLRYYLNHRASLQGEWQFQKLQESETKTQRFERRFQFGVAIDF